MFFFPRANLKEEQFKDFSLKYLVMVSIHFTGRDHAREINGTYFTLREFLHVITREMDFT